MIETDVMVGSGMKIVCRRDEFAQRLNVVSRAVSTRATVQILSGILLHITGEGLELAATDMELSLRTTLSAQIDGDGAVVVPGRRLVELAKLLPAEEVEIEHKPEESVLHVTSGSASYTLHTYNAEDFPRLPDVTSLQTFAVDREALLETIARVARSASRDESPRARPAGAHVHRESRLHEHPRA